MIRYFKWLKIVNYYFIFCGVSVNTLFAGIYFYDKSIIASVTDKIETKLKLTINPNALVEEQKALEAQLNDDIVVNFGEWQPLFEKYAVAPQTVKIGEMTYKSITEANNNLQNGQTMLIGEGTYKEAIIIKKNNIKMIGSGRVTLDGVATGGKGAIIAQGENITIQNIECKNISVGDQNGACVRAEGDNLTVDHVYFHDSEEGILGNAPAKHINVINSRFEKLGKSGYAHGIYVSSEELNIENSLFISSVSEGHEIKSRGKKTIISKSVVASLSGNDSRLIDIPNGGELVIHDSVLEKGPQSVNSTAIGFGLEGIKHTVNKITINKSVIILERKGFNKLFDIAKNQTVPITTTNNILITKENETMDGLNWIFENREDAKINDYPYIPVIENK